MARRLVHRRLLMKNVLIAGVSALAFAALPAPAAAQMSMPGMHMPMPEKKAAPKKKATAKKSSKAKPVGASSQPMPMDHSHMPGMQMPMPAQPPAGAASAMPPMDHSQMGGMGGMPDGARRSHGPHGNDRSARTLSDGARILRHRVAAGRVRAHGTDEHVGRLDADGARHREPGLRPPVRTSGRRQGVRIRHADGHGASAARPRHAAVQGDAQPRPADGPARLSAPACERRDGERPRSPDRPPASARSVHGAVGVSLAGHRGQEQRLPLRRPARRTGVRPARLHAPRSDHGLARGADHPPLARFHAHHLRSVDGRRSARPDQDRGKPLQRPRARPAPLGHRNGAARFDRGSSSRGIRPARCRCKAAGGISSTPSSSSPESTRNAGRQARSMPTTSRRAGSSPARSLGGGRSAMATRTTASPRRRRSSMPTGPSSGAAR